MSETQAWIEVTDAECNALNASIEDLEDDESLIGFTDGTVFPYLGFNWRYVPFRWGITLGHSGTKTGFMESNKWNFPEWKVSEPERREIITRLRAMRSEGATLENTQAFYAYIQTLATPEIPEKELTRGRHMR